MTERRIELNNMSTGNERDFSESRGKGIEMVHARPADSVPFPASPGDGGGDTGTGQAPAVTTSAAAPDFDD